MSIILDTRFKYSGQCCWKRI